MVKKKLPLIAPGVTTKDALSICLSQHVRAFVIENPLYTDLVSCKHGFDCLEDYELDIRTDKQIILCRKVKGENRFDSKRFTIHYLPLTWDHWHS